jgi:hypothetical protein
MLKFRHFQRLLYWFDWLETAKYDISTIIIIDVEPKLLFFKFQILRFRKIYVLPQDTFFDSFNSILTLLRQLN